MPGDGPGRPRVVRLDVSADGLHGVRLPAHGAAVRRSAGGPASPGRKRTTPRTVAKYALYLLVSAYLAHTFLAYFVGVEALAQWVRRSPLEHPISFLVMLAVTGLMMFDFAYFREQTCIVACPYGRFQSVMLDRDSLIVSYDPRRGEPRGKLGGPQGRRVLWRLHRLRRVHRHLSHGHRHPRGFATGVHRLHAVHRRLRRRDAADRQAQRPDPAELAGRHRGQPGRLLRLRVILYPALMLVLATAFLIVFFNKKSADVTILQGLGLPYSVTAAGEITNQVQVIIENRSGRDAVYKIEIPGSTRPVSPDRRRPFRWRPARAPRRPLAIVTPAAVFNGASATSSCAYRMTRLSSKTPLAGCWGPFAGRRTRLLRKLRNEQHYERFHALVEKPSRHLFWPILLTSLISIHIVSVVVMVIVATHDSSFAVEPDWYLKGLNYEQTVQQQRENSRLGWSVQLNVGRPLTGTNQRNVTCTVLDRAGKPVENATVDLVAFAHLQASNRTSACCCPRGRRIRSHVGLRGSGDVGVPARRHAG